jgi:chromosome segregation protein
VHLRGIKLRGFKSFPDALELRFEPGVAVVVGPNGSGKSNVADAILWASGSLSPSELRAEKPDDVLFAGSAGRDPAGFCEVELMFDNADGRLAELDYAEVSIARRLQRGGEGQYLVNRTPVRRLDLVELLADVGLGGGMHSVIGQGRVEAILASRPEERRALIEEAAGLGKFKRRRHRAELKLARVALQVERARDVEAEVRARLRPLALQATAAERAERLRGEIAIAEATLASLDLAAIAERAAEIEERRVAAGLARRRVDERLDELLAERSRAEEELADAAGAREAALAALYMLRGGIERVELRRESAQDLRSRLSTELLSAKSSGGRDEESEGLARAAADAAAAAQAAETEGVAISAAAAEAWSRLRALERRDRDEAVGRLDDLVAERAELDDALVAVTARRDSAAAALYRLRGEAERVSVRAESAAALRRLVEQDLAAAPAASRGPTPRELERAAVEAGAAARTAAAERERLADEARLVRDRLAAVERALAEREGIPPAARALAERGEQLALSLLQVESGAERAVAAALRHRAAALVAADPKHGLELLRQARRGGLGSLAIVVPAASPAPAEQPPGSTALRDLVFGPEHIVSLLDGAWLVEEPRLLETRSGIAVTLEGHGYDADRNELWFAGEAAEAVLLELDARSRLLADELAALEGAGARAVEAAKDADAAAAHAEHDFAGVAHLVHRPVLDAASLSRIVGLTRRLDDALSICAARAEGLAAPLAARAAHEAAGVEKLTLGARGLLAREGALRAEAGQAAERALAAEHEAARFGAGEEDTDAGGERAELEPAATAAAAAADTAAERAREAVEVAAAAEAELRRIAPRLRSRAIDIASLERLAEDAERLDEVLLRSASAGRRFEAPLRARADAGSQRTGELGDALRRLGADESELRRAAAEAAERVGHVEVELARLQADEEETRRRLDEAGVDPAEEELGRDELAARIERLRRRLEALGLVNPLAKEAYEAEKERLAELVEQRVDLEASLAELEKLARDLGETVERRFSETFAAVNEHFAEVAATLFPGGTGRLVLAEAEEEDGEPGIEVELHPAGKRVTRLSLLSGGEKALGAISFLFALVLAHPCPFYLLDEVEAALDDTNIGRFVELLRRYADRAQFIVVTHQKRTMEAADILYGVTMGADGVSQVVSRRLPREAEALATA